MQKLPNLLGIAFYNNFGILKYKRNIDKLINMNYTKENTKEFENLDLQISFYNCFNIYNTISCKIIERNSFLKCHINNFIINIDYEKIESIKVLETNKISITSN